MSIISDALKKAQNKRENSIKGDTNWFAEIVNSPNETRAKRTKNLKIVLIILSIVLLLMASSLLVIHQERFRGFISIEKTSSPIPDSEIRVTEPIAPSEVEPAEVEPEVVLPGPERLPEPEPVKSHQMPVFSGVMYMDNEPRAILDGRSFAVGESVHELTVKEITDDKVVLTDSESEFTLKLH